MASKSNTLVLVLVALVAAVAIGAGGWYYLNKGEPAAVDNPSAQEAGPADPLPASSQAAAAPTPTAPTETFSQAAVVDDPNGFTTVRSGPSTLAPTVARINSGEIFFTYLQGGDWWRVRTAGGQTGYMSRSRIRVRTDVAVTTTETGPVAAPPPSPRVAAPRPRPKSRINRANSANMRAFCENAGAGTPQCRSFRRELGGR